MFYLLIATEALHVQGDCLRKLLLEHSTGFQTGMDAVIGIVNYLDEIVAIVD